MSVRIHTDLASHFDVPIRASVSEALSEQEGKWEVNVAEVLAVSAWDVSVAGPNGFRWTKRFTAAERDAKLIAHAIRTTIEMATTDLSNALSGLITSGLAYIIDDQPDGSKIYIIDRIRLREAEIIALQKHGSLTREGIRQYLVSRVA